ncbi:MAG: hypothetical protein HQM04_10780 [Magnetococcales bacterium]|nr:hypothetical protein [Magnetococcales bacterium]MBF0115508.1 hypothetical protein [Magnetococcales bacterium]
MHDLISPTLAAALIGCHAATLTNWRKSKKGPPVVIIEGSTSLAYSRSEVIKWMQDQEKKSK